MIYQGDNWPIEYRNKLYTINIHGRRLNCDRLVQSDDGYVATHDDDFMLSKDPFFRGVEAKYGPDGGVFVLDWNDTGECHDFVDIQVQTGRIFKITYGSPKQWKGDLRSLTNDELIAFQSHENAWFARTARRILQERVVSGKTNVANKLKTRWHTESDPHHRLRLFWCLGSCGYVDAENLKTAIDGSVAERIWAIRHLLDAPSGEHEAIVDAIEPALSDDRGLVMQEIVSAALHAGDSNRLLQAVVSIAAKAQIEDSKFERRLQQLIWYAIERHVDESFAQSYDSESPNAISGLASIPLIGSCMAQKLSSMNQPGVALRLAIDANNDHARAAILESITESLRGHNVIRPKEWEFVRQSVLSGPIRSNQLGHELGMIFGDIAVRKELEASVDSTTSEDASAALSLLLKYPDAHTAAIVDSALKRSALRERAIRGTATVNMPATIESLADRYGQLKAREQAALIDAMVSRANYAKILLNRIESNVIPISALTALAAGQLSRFKDQQLQTRLTRVYGSVSVTDKSRRMKINRMKRMFTDDALDAANIHFGKKLYTAKCSACHKLFGEGEAIGPELTGGQRQSIDYFLENVIAPNALVPYAYKVKVVQTVDGRVLSGIVDSEDNDRVVLQTPKEKITVSKDDIETISATGVSLMPEGLLEDLTNDQIIDLAAFFMSDADHTH